MRAALLRDVGKPFEVRDDVELDGPSEGQVQIRLAASGICHSDLSSQNGTFGRDALPMPCVLGHEGAGTVVGLGSGVTELTEGDHVIVSWVTPCGSCRYCLSGHANLCLTGMTLLPPVMHVGGTPIFALNGTFAEEIVLPARAAIRIPSDVPLEMAALLGCGVMTGAGAALNTAKVEPGSTVIVFGCGGVGLNVLQGARIAGATDIVAVDPIPEKRDIARRFGATDAIGTEQIATAIGDLTEGVGFDYAFEVVGKAATIRSAFDATRRGGTTVVVGAGSPEELVSFNAWELFSSEKRLIGSLYGSADVRVDYHRLLSFWRRGMLDLEGLISARIDLSEIDDAFAALDRGEVVRSLIVYG